MQTLQSYVDNKNKWGEFFGQPRLDLNNAQDRQRIANSIDADLSPENLTCDGELSASAVRRNYQRLVTAARELRQLDPNVKFYETI